MASVGVGHGEPGLHGGPHGSSLGLGPCLGGLALMEAIGEAGGPWSLARLAPPLVATWLPEPHPAGAAWLLAADGPLAHGHLGLAHGLALGGFHGLVFGIGAAGLHGLHALHALHGLHGLHVGTLYDQKTEGSATRWSPERVTGVTIRSHNPIFAAIHCTKLRLVQMRQPK